MPAALVATLLALQLAGAPHDPPAPPPAAAARAWDDDAGDLARLGRLAVRFDLAVIRRDADLLAHVEGRVREEIADELEEARRERRRGIDRRVGSLERAGRVFGDLKERVDLKSLDRKRTALAEVSEAAWLELASEAGGHERWRAPRQDRWDDRRERDDDRGWRDDREAFRAPPVAQPMPADQFEGLHRAMRHEAFAEGRLRVLDTALAATDALISVEQVGRLLGLFSFSQEQLTVVRKVRPRLLDPERGYTLMERFTFDSDKEALRRILQE